MTFDFGQVSRALTVCYNPSLSPPPPFLDTLRHAWGCSIQLCAGFSHVQAGGGALTLAESELMSVNPVI